MMQPHILCTENDVEERVILPGDPQRVLRAAQYLDDWKEIAFNREFRTITGTYKTVPVTIVSTGIGGASAAIALEELIACGARQFIRIGSCGAVQPGIDIGYIVIPIAAVREDGASRMYISDNYPAVADFGLANTIINTCESLKYPYVSGFIRSHDSFYIDDESSRLEFWSKKGIIASDMETAALFTIGRLRGVKISCILNNVVRYESKVKEGITQYVSEEQMAVEGEKREIILALEALYRDFMGEKAVCRAVNL